MVGHPNIPHNIDRILAPKKKRPEGIWERKSEADIKLIKAKIKKSSLNITFPLASLIFGFIGCYFVLDLIGLNTLKYCILFSIVSFFSAYFFQLIYGRAIAKSPRFRICNKCFRENRFDLKTCQCGGMLEPPEFYIFFEQSK
jgi:hypothetical protein